MTHQVPAIPKTNKWTKKIREIDRKTKGSQDLLKE